MHKRRILPAPEAHPVQKEAPHTPAYPATLLQGRERYALRAPKRLSTWFMKSLDRSTLSYPEHHTGRDLRIDFLRGLVMMVVIVVHLEFISLFGMFAWGRVGMISSAEGFVALSGLVAGIVYRKKAEQDGFWVTAKKLLKRAFLLYRVNVFVILSIAVLGGIPFIDVYDLTHWASVTGNGPIYDLYPPQGTPWVRIVAQALLLKFVPHQFQVIGLYVVLLALAPLFLYLLVQRKTSLLLGVSWALYLFNQFNPIRLTGAGFEFGFPTLNWQLLFINGMAAGYHRDQIAAWFHKANKHFLIFASVALCLAFLFLANNRPNPTFWPGPQFSVVDPDLYYALYHYAFQKGGLGIGRVINNLVLYITIYFLLTRYWRVFYEALGWLLIPIGQASLYVFIVHVYVVLLVGNTPFPGYHSFAINTLIHAGAILIIWLMVKKRFLFNLIPR
ncbi:MAG: OpgC domain-containing protein [Methylococcaceae bacterium]|nr:OpgC domain-containing protein [Methylococcaceae bacterium]